MLAAGRERIRKAVIDAGPLFSALLLNYTRTVVPARRDPLLDRSPISEFLRGRTDLQADLLELFRSIPTLLTTSYVIAEVNGLSLKLKGIDKQEFWRTGMLWLKEGPIDERFARLLDMEAQRDLREPICQIGPVDTGLIKLAQEEGCCLLTDDQGTLAQHAWRRGVDCKVVAQYLDHQ
jgi:rRNA-processing protein FCF1